MNAEIVHPFYNGIGSKVGSGILPNQFLPESQKNDKFKKRTMDALESIGLSQLSDNIGFRDFYKMTEGSLVYSDYGIDEGILGKIKSLGGDMEIPSFLKHYDIIGILVNQMVGEWIGMRDEFTIDSVGDEVSQNDFISERTERVQEYSRQSFDLELKKRLIERGINPEGQEFESEEEQQAYIQQIEQVKASLRDPSQIELDMQKDWKTKAAEWAEHVIEADQERFYLDTIDAEEMKDYLLTGRSFRHYHVGYDNYKPERWNPIQTFFSKDMDAKYPQDGEYVGRITYMSPSDIAKRWGHLISPRDIKRLNKGLGNDGYSGANGSIDLGVSYKSLGKPFQPQTIPYGSYYERELGLQIQEAMDIPMGVYLNKDKEGNDVETPTFLSQDWNHNYTGTKYSGMLRDDITTRTDVLQVTEAYFRSWKRMWFLNYTTPEGISDTSIVTDELLQGFIEENSIRKITTKSIKDIKADLEPNTMYEFWIPEVWGGVKINDGNSQLTTPIYVNVEALPYQIKGDSNVFDVKLPVGGIIGTSTAKKLRPYQVGYNVCLNQMFNLLEKEIGTFFLFDINFLPSDMKNQGTTEEALLKLRDLAQSVGLVPLDTRKQNMEGANPQMNTFMTQSITYDVQIRSRIELANWYQQKALEQIGVTQQRLGNPGKYETAAGVEQGTKASYTQTEQLFGEMSTARRKSMELHLAVAQYCQKEYIDVDMVFSKSDGDKQYMHLSDKDFPLRRLGIIPINNSKKRRTLEEFKQTLLNTNTLGNDMLDYAQLFSADTMGELVAIGRKNRLEKEKEVAEQREHEQTLVDKQLQATSEEKQADRVFAEESKEKDRQARLQERKIEAIGRAVDKDTDQTGLNAVERISNIALKQQDSENKNSLEEKKIEMVDQKSATEHTFNMKKLELEIEKLKQKDRQMATDKFIAVKNKN